MKPLRLSGCPIAYYITGREHREWVLFLHAAFVNHRMFQAQTEYFRDRYNVLTLDIIGHGNSADGKGGMDKMADWIREILQKEGIERVHLVGVSLGAVLAQDFAGQYPEMVRSLACFGGYDIYHFDPRLQRENSAAQMGMMVKALVSIRWFAEANKRISACTERAQAEFYEMNLGFSKKSFRYFATLGKIGKTGPKGPRAYPLLIGCGERDIPSALTVLEDWKRREPDCGVVIFEGAGHCANMDTPERFNRVLEQFLTTGSALLS